MLRGFDQQASRQIYREHKAEEEKEIARETEEVEEKVFLHEIRRLFAEELEQVVSHLHRSTCGIIKLADCV